MRETVNRRSTSETRSSAPYVETPPLRQPLSPNHAVHRIILAVDIKGSTATLNSAKIRLRRAMYELTEKALSEAGITDHHHEPLVDRGDSLLALIRPTDDVPKSVLLDTVVPTLTRLLTEHNADNPDYCFRLRVVVHAGEVHWDGRGWFGESLDIAFRLLDAPAAKQQLARTDRATALVVSDYIHQSVVRQGYDGIDARSFKPSVLVRVAGRAHQGWIQDVDSPDRVTAQQG